MFKYLPLNKKKLVYTKKENAETKLEPYIRNQISAIIEDYLENGTEKSGSDEESSMD